MPATACGIRWRREKGGGGDLLKPVDRAVVGRVLRPRLADLDNQDVFLFFLIER